MKKKIKTYSSKKMNPTSPVITCLDTSPEVISKFYNTFFFKTNQSYTPNQRSKQIQKIMTMSQISKFFLLKGICRKFSFKPQRRIIFETGQRIPGKYITFYQNDKTFKSVNIDHLLFFVKNITPFISYRMLERIHEIQQRNNIFHNINEMSGGVWSLPKLFSSTQQPIRPERETTSLAALADSSASVNRINPSQLLSLKITLLISVLDLIPGTFTKNSYSLQHLYERFFDNFKENLTDLAEKISLNQPISGTNYSLPGQKAQLIELNKQFELYKSIFNYLILTKLILNDRTDEDILPFFDGAQADMREYLKYLAISLHYLDGIKNRQDINNLLYEDNEKPRNEKIVEIINKLLELAPELNHTRNEESQPMLGRTGERSPAYNKNVPSQQVIRTGPFSGIPLSGVSSGIRPGAGGKKRRSSSKSKTSKKKKSTSIKKKKKVTKA